MRNTIPTQNLARRAGTLRGRANRERIIEIRNAIRYGMKIGGDIRSEQAYDRSTQKKVAEGYLRELGLIE